MRLFGRSLLLLSGLFLMSFSFVLPQMRRDYPYSHCLLFWSSRDGNLEIYRMHPDGTGQKNITNNPADDSFPSWSPDGSWIVFSSDRDGNSDIYRMRPDGTRLQNLTKHPSADWLPQWSPDGKWIMFISRRAGNTDIYKMRADGSAVQNLTNNPGDDRNPQWSPDGRRILFESVRDGNWEIYWMDAEGAEVMRLTYNHVYDSEAQWSPDGKTVVYQSYNDIAIVQSDGNNVQNLTQTPDVIEAMPFWSMDGNWIFYESNRPGYGDVLRIRADGTEMQSISTDVFRDWNVSVAPDNKWLSFVSARDGQFQIYRVRPDGSAEQNLSRHTYNDWGPLWSPVIDKNWHNKVMGLVGVGLAAFVLSRYARSIA